MAIDFYVLALWFAYSLAFAISVAFLYHSYKKTLQQIVVQVEAPATPYFIDIEDEKARAMLALAEEIVDVNPKRALDLAKGALELLLERACKALGVNSAGTMEEKVKRLQVAGLVLPPDFWRISALRRPREVVMFVKSIAKFLKEAPILVKKGESPSV